MSEKEKIIDKTDEIIENCKCVRCGGILERYVFGEVKCADCGKLHNTLQPVAVRPNPTHLTFPLTYKFGDVIGSITIDAQVIQMIEQKLLEDTPGAKRINAVPVEQPDGFFKCSVCGCRLEYYDGMIAHCHRYHRKEDT